MEKEKYSKPDISTEILEQNVLSGTNGSGFSDGGQNGGGGCWGWWVN
jgi:hypothetical protein